MKHAQLGKLLVGRGAIDELQLQSALAQQRKFGTPLGRVLVESRFCSEDQVMAALGEQLALSTIDLDLEPLTPALAQLLPERLAERYRAVPLGLEGRRQEVLRLAIAAPAPLTSLDAVQAVTGKHRVIPHLASDGAIDRAIDRLYRRRHHKAEPVVAAAPKVSIAVVEEESPSLVGPPPVLLYGWTEDAGRALALMLAAEGIEVRVAGPEELSSAGPAAVLVAPLPTMEALAQQGGSFRGALVAISRDTGEQEMARARQVGAKGFVAAPIDGELLVRSVRRCLSLSAPSAQA